MFSFALYLLPIATAAACILYLPLTLWKRPLPPMQHGARILLLGTLLMIAYATIFWYGMPKIAEHRFLNLVPFAWIWKPYEMGLQSTLEQLLINVVMFLPLGVLLPIVFPRLRGFFKTALVCLCCTLAIEAVQYFTGRSADIDDVLCNLLGGMAGYPVFLFIRTNRTLKPLFFGGTTDG